MTIDDVLKFFNSATNMNRKIGISISSMQNWKEKGYIPIETQVRIEKLTKGKLKADLAHCGAK